MGEADVQDMNMASLLGSLPAVLAAAVAGAPESLETSLLKLPMEGKLSGIRPRSRQASLDRNG